MKKLFIAITLVIGIIGIVLQFWIAYIYFYEPYDPDDYLHDIKVYECTLKEEESGA